jgi:hypothetical protein
MSEPMQNPCKDVVATEADWIVIMEAYVAWLKGEGPPVQRVGPIPGQHDWIDWTSRIHIAKTSSFGDRWRIKPQPWRARMYRTFNSRPGQSAVDVMIWYPTDEEPATPNNCEWVGDWIDISGTDQ